MHQHYCPECERWWDCDDLCAEDDIEQICPECNLKHVEDRAREESDAD